MATLRHFQITRTTTQHTPDKWKCKAPIYHSAKGHAACRLSALMQAVTRLTQSIYGRCPVRIFGHDTHYTEIFRGASQSPQTSGPIRPLPLPTALCPRHYTAYNEPPTVSLIRLHIKQISKYVACFTCTIRGYCAAISLLGSVLKQSCGCTLCV